MDILGAALAVIGVALIGFAFAWRRASKNEEREARIHEMLDDAVANEYDIEDWPADDIVLDLFAYADLEDDDTEDAIRPHVISWLKERR